jgi:hypothetical protein
MRRVDDELERLGAKAVHTSALTDRIAHSAPRVLQGSVLYLDGKPVGQVHSFAPAPAGKGEAPAKKIGGSFSITGPRGAEDPGNSPDLRPCAG